MMEDVSAALIAFYDTEKRILLQDRRDRSKYGEDWSFVGGKLEGTEDPYSALVREVWQETGHKLTQARFILDYNTLLNDGRLLRRYVFMAPADNDLKEALKRPTLERLSHEFFSLPQARKLKLVKGAGQILDMLENLLV